MNGRLNYSDVERSAPWQTDYFRTWGPTVLRFCELFLGDKTQAEQAAISAFVESAGNGVSALGERTPVQLLSCAFRVCRDHSEVKELPRDALHAAILHLGRVDRGVFILHSALSIPFPWAAAILGISHENTLQLWARALIEVRNSLLATGYFKERSR